MTEQLNSRELLMILNKVSMIFLMAIAISLPCQAVSQTADNAHIFEDQDQYEIFYEYVHSVTFTEVLLSNCVGDRSIAAKYYINVSLSSAYQEILLGISVSKDAFLNRSLTKRLWREFARGVMRGGYSYEAGDPIASAQHSAHVYFDEFEEERGFLCDYIWWEEFAKLGELSNLLVRDAKARYSGQENLMQFLEEIKPQERNFQKVAGHSPWAN